MKVQIKNTIAVLSLLAILFSSQSCQDKKKVIKALDISNAVMTGVWQNGQMFITYKSYEGGTYDSTLLLNQFNYERIMGSTRQSILFNSNGDYTASSIRFQNGDTIKSYGHWQANDNTLIIDYGPVRNDYEVMYLKTDSIKLKGIIDLDTDGEKDDIVELIIVKL